MYEDNLEGFIKWSTDNKTFMDSDIKHKEYFQVYDKHDNKYYVELNKIQIREMSNKPFVGESIFKYRSLGNGLKEDFIHISKYNPVYESKYWDAMERLILTIKDFCERNNIEMGKLNYVR